VNKRLLPGHVERQKGLNEAELLLKARASRPSSPQHNSCTTTIPSISAHFIDNHTVDTLAHPIASPAPFNTLQRVCRAINASIYYVTTPLSHTPSHYNGRGRAQGCTCRVTGGTERTSTTLDATKKSSVTDRLQVTMTEAPTEAPPAATENTEGEQLVSIRRVPLH